MKTNRRILVTSIVGTVLLFLVSACGSAQPTLDAKEATPEGEEAAPTSEECVIRLGSVRPLTGKGASFGSALAEGLYMGFDAVNAQGGILGCQVELVAYDSQSDPAIAATLTERLITQDQVVLVIGSSISTESLAMMEVTENAQVPIFIPSAASAKITSQGYEWVWRQSVIDSSAAALFTEYIVNDLGWKRVGALYENTDYGKLPIENIVGPGLAAGGSELVIAEAFNPGDVDVSGQLLRIVDAGVDGIIYWGHENEASLLVRDNQRLGFDLPLAGNTGIVYPAFLELLSVEDQANTELIAVSQFVWTTDDPEQLVWIEEFKTRFGHDPNVTSMDGYDAAFVLQKAFEAAGSTDNLALQQAISAVEYTGVGGFISFDETGQAVRSLVIVKLTSKDGKGFEIIKEVEPGEY